MKKKIKITKELFGELDLKKLREVERVDVINEKTVEITFIFEE